MIRRKKASSKTINETMDTCDLFLPTFRCFPLNPGFVRGMDSGTPRVVLAVVPWFVPEFFQEVVGPLRIANGLEVLGDPRLGESPRDCHQPWGVSYTL